MDHRQQNRDKLAQWLDDWRLREHRDEAMPTEAQALAHMAKVRAGAAKAVRLHEAEADRALHATNQRHGLPCNCLVCVTGRNGAIAFNEKWWDRDESGQSRSQTVPAPIRHRDVLGLVGNERTEP